jgi:hypothetical protein
MYIYFLYGYHNEEIPWFLDLENKDPFSITE